MLMLQKKSLQHKPLPVVEAQDRHFDYDSKQNIANVAELTELHFLDVSSESSDLLDSRLLTYSCLAP